MAFKFVAFWLCAICIVFFILQIILPGFTEVLLLTSGSWSQPWRFLTAIFLHGDLTHLIYNMFALALFGSILESLIGSRKFLILFFVTGIFANIVAVNFYPSSLGASGAIFGVIGSLIIVLPSLIVWAFGLPMPIFIAGILWAVGDVIGTFNPSSNVGTIAHLAGMGFGLLFGVFYRNWSKRSYHREKMNIDEIAIRNWEDKHLR